MCLRSLADIFVAFVTDDAGAEFGVEDCCHGLTHFRSLAALAERNYAGKGDERGGPEPVQ